jgi:hypothetical protein
MGKLLAVAVTALGTSLLGGCAPYPYEPYRGAPAYVSSGVPAYGMYYAPIPGVDYIPPSIDFSPGGDHQHRHRRSRR